MSVGDHGPVRPAYRFGRSRSADNRQPPAPAPIPSVGETIAVTCCTDSRAHEVPDTELAIGIARHDGYYRALCGHMIAAAPMVMPDGEPCQRCAALRDDRPRRQRRGRRFLG